MPKANNDSKTVLSVGGSVCQLDGSRLRISDQDGMVLDICVAPAFDAQEVQIRSWVKVGQNRYESDLGDQAFQAALLSPGTLGPIKIHASLDAFR